MTKFAVGDKVKCVDNSGSQLLKFGEIYEVSGHEHGYVSLKGHASPYFTSRFVLCGPIGRFWVIYPNVREEFEDKEAAKNRARKLSQENREQYYVMELVFRVFPIKETEEEDM